MDDFLMMYRSTPHSTTGGISHTELLFGRKIRTFYSCSEKWKQCSRWGLMVYSIDEM